MLTKEQAIIRLREWFPKGATVYTILRHVSKSGMMRRISVVAILKRDDGTPYLVHPDYTASVALDRALNRNKQGIRINGCGMDMGFSIAYELGQALYNDGYAFRHEWI